MAGLDSDSSVNPLIPFSDIAAETPLSGTSASGGAAGLVSASEGSGIRPLSQMAWDRMNPQEQAAAIADQLTGGGGGTSSVSNTSTGIYTGDLGPAPGPLDADTGVGSALGKVSGAAGSEFGLVPGKQDPFLPQAQAVHGVNEAGSAPNVSAGADIKDFGYGPKRAPITKFVTDNQSTRDAIVEYAQSMLGVPYVWGGTSRSGVDCSGLVQLAYAHAGIPMPRVVGPQMSRGEPVDFKKLKPGDLIGWGIHHIAIYIGDGKYIEAPRTGLTVRISELGSYNPGEMWAVRITGKPQYVGTSQIAHRVEAGRITIRQAEYESAKRASRSAARNAPKYTKRSSGHPTQRRKATPVKNRTKKQARLMH